ncbi:MAG TPA: hybrid sensor histidine kinase/response regulator [Cyanobacteria bacterium UBA11369]|nr:hybrid sensor histidine kinase/response regulator [Cyanobacteria bacterium UBA11371]HBE36202.1 hybrid sensor histidine kinase/response regulator [Cyanobacteria bacterium UBA11368]HBE51217.1 hybrid sensor histidine kinase/response regulator [Cyanobacteria bacterium UBA11369]
MSKILVVEDDSATRLFLKRDLQMEGYQVTVAKNGAEGLLQATQIQPALIICDWVMPLIDGMEVCRRVKADPNLATAFFILLTSRGEAIADRVAGLDAGADEFLSKPIDPNELQARVRAGLRQYNLNRQLSQANQQLSQTLQQLQQTQAQLIQSEKMSSMVQMVAGMAHEINNPITFIYGNLNHASVYIQNLLELIHLYQKHYPNPNAEIQQHAVEIDLEFVTHDLPNLLASMKTGAQRIFQIVQDLRNFSRLDEAELKLVDLHEGIDNTLQFLQHRLNYKGNNSTIKVVKEYGKLPLVECYPRQLNQVFLNILSNAIDFLTEGQEKQNQSPQPTIHIRTQAIDDEGVQIKILDNGPGMTEKIRQKLFDPFFTTKQVGKGIGMGLSISYQIVVEKHGGQLRCISTPGQGAEFIIEIPLQPPK